LREAIQTSRAGGRMADFDPNCDIDRLQTYCARAVFEKSAG